MPEQMKLVIEGSLVPVFYDLRDAIAKAVETGWDNNVELLGKTTMALQRASIALGTGDKEATRAAMMEVAGLAACYCAGNE